jgi:recombination DNA repair RAD52 pathway protein
MSERLLRKFKCKCGDYFKSKYTKEELDEMHPWIPDDKSLRNLHQINKWIKKRRKVICSSCGKSKTISKRLLVKLSKLRKEEKE